jgi:hypothetical protein
MNEYALYHESFRAAASGGTLCRGPECSGWHLSEVDTWHRCSGRDCGGAQNTTHPEHEEYADEAGDEVAPLAPTLPAPPNDDDDYPF